MNHDRLPRKVTLEDLLRLKRAERPPAEFWTKFESDLRAKQLAAIVEKQPWWHVMPRAFAGMARLHLPVGATAVMAVTIFAIGGYRVASVDRGVTESAVVPEAGLVNAESSTSTSNLPKAGVMNEAVVVSMTELPTTGSSEISRTVSSSGSSSLASDTPQNSAHSARAIIDGNLEMSLVEAPQVAASELSGGMTRTHAFEARAVMARIKSEPLAQVRTPMDDRRERYLGRSLPGNYGAETANGHLTARPAEVLNRHFNERRFHESDGISRFGAYGAGVSIKL